MADEEIELTQDQAGDIIGRLQSFVGMSMAFITEAQNPVIAAWQVSFALGTDNCVGHTMTSKAQELGVGVACLSKGAVRVCRMLGLPPSPWMLPEKSADQYRKLRETQEAERKQHLAKEKAK